MGIKIHLIKIVLNNIVLYYKRKILILRTKLNITIYEILKIMFRVIQYIGNQELLKMPKTLFVCSKRAPIATYERIFGWVESLTEKDVVVCCNTTELEMEVMKSLVVNHVPTVLVVMNRFREENNVQIQKALREKRMLVVVMEQTDKKRWSPKDRNEFLINKIADHIVGGYIDKRGSLFPMLVGKKNLKALTHNLVSDFDTKPDKSYQRWTVEEDKTLLRMFYEDYSIHEIKKKLNRTYAAAIERIHALTMSEDVLKGREFEEYILELLDIKKGKYILREWRGDKTMGDVSPENNSYPDFLIEEVDTKRSIAIECKWRKSLNHAVTINLFSPERLTFYHEFSQEKNLPVFIVLGIGGEPCEPDDVYIIPLKSVSFELIQSKKTPNVLVNEPSQLKPFKRTNAYTPLCFNEFPSEDLKPKETSSQKQSSNYIIEKQKDYPNAYKPWTPSEEKALVLLYKKRKSTEELSKCFGRKKGAIRSRLGKLGFK